MHQPRGPDGQTCARNRSAPPSPLFARDRAEALVVGSGAFFFAQRERLAALAARHAIPAIYNLRNFVTAGGLMSYGPILLTPIASSASMSAGYCAAWRPAICRSCSRRSSSLL